MQENKVLQKEKVTKLGLWASVVMGATMLCMSSSGQAALLGVDLQFAPDITSSFITVDYNAGAGTDNFSAIGIASELQLISGTTSFMGGFNLSATISDTGVLSSGGLLTITNGMGTMLTGNLTGLFFNGPLDAPSSTLEFLFNVIGGNLAATYGSTGAVILSSTGFMNSWNGNFDASDAMSNTGVRVSAPATAWLLGTALIGLLGFTRRKQK